MTYKTQGATWGQRCEPVLAESSLFRKIESLLLVYVGEVNKIQDLHT